MARADLSASGERGTHAATVFALLAAVGLAWGLSTGDLTYRYVASWTSSFVPLPYRIGALWAGPSGVLLLWAIALGAGASVAAATLRRGSALRVWTAALLALLLLAVLAMACFDTNPFLRLPFPPDDGRGLPLEWQRPIALLQAPLGYVAMALLAIPSVMTVMGALGTAPWRGDARRWAALCWALLSAAMLMDWRRHYGDAAWVDMWRWAPVATGTAFAWAGAGLLVVASRATWRAGIAVSAGFAAFTLGLVGLTMRRAGGWSGVHDFVASDSARAVGLVLIGLVVAVAVTLLYVLRNARGIASRAAIVSSAAAACAALALASTTLVRTSDVAVREGERATVTDRFGTAWTLSLEGVSQVGRENVLVSAVAVRAAVKGHARGFVTAEVRSLFVGEGREPTDQLMVSGISSGLAQDLRIDVREANTADAILTVSFIPAASWVWIAGIAAVLAAIIAAFGTPTVKPPEATPDESRTAEGPDGDSSGASPSEAALDDAPSAVSESQTQPAELR